MQVALNGSVFDRVTFAVKRTTYLGDRTISLETHLRDDLALGGFGRIKLAMYLEELFDVELLDEVVERFVTIADVVKYIGEHYFRDIEPAELAEAA